MIILAVIVVLYIISIVLKNEKGNRIRSLLPVMAVLIISFLISLIPVKGTERPSLETTAKTFFDFDYKSNVLRLNFWAASLKMIKENPITGIGLYKWSGYYPKYSGDYFNDENLTYVQNIHAHNDFLELFAESGILAVLVFLLISLSIAHSLFRKIKHNEKYFPLLLTFLITFAYSIVAFPNYKFASYFLATIAAGTALIVPGGKVK